MRLEINQRFDYDGLSVSIGQQHHLPDKILVRAKCPAITLEVGTGIDMRSDEVQIRLHNLIFNAGKAVAADLLFGRAQEISSRLNVAPSGWRISKARRRALGSCNSRRVISFSPLIVFVPQEIRDYIICHELSHLVHFNHSRAFHDLCDRFCREITGKGERYFKNLEKEVFNDKNSLVNSLILTSRMKIPAVSKRSVSRRKGFSFPRWLRGVLGKR